MSEKLQIEITANDKASAAFARAAGGADKLDQSLERAARTSINMSAVGDQLGRAFHTTSIFLQDSARIAQEAEVSQQRLQTAIEATGVSYEDYADRIDAAGEAAVQMAFDDEAMMDALSSMVAATGDASQAIDQLGLVMDIARGRGIDLAAAAKIVIAADQERFGSLARIGIQLDENATKEEALAALQAKYSGQAAAYAETTAGQVGRLSQEFENAREGLAQYSDEATTLAFVLPTVASAVGTLNAALVATAGISLVGIAPALIAIGIAAGTAYVGYEALTQEGNVTTQSMEDLTAAATDVTGALSALALGGDAAAVSIGANAQTILQQATGDLQEYFKLIGESATFQPGRASAEEQAAHDVNMARLAELTLKYGEWETATDDVAGAEKDLLTVLNNGGAGRDLALQGLERLNEEFDKGNISPETYASGIEMLAGQLGLYNIMAGDATTTTAGLTKGMEAAGDALTYQLGEKAKLAVEVLADTQEELAATFEQTRATVTQASDSLETMFRVIVGNTDGIAKQSQAVQDWSTSLTEVTDQYDDMGNVIGQWSAIDELLTTVNHTTGEFQITQTEANAALQANTDIWAANERIQADVLSIQAQLSPIVAGATEALADQMDVLAGGSTDAQLFALGMMDATTASQALSLAQAYLKDQDTFGPMLVQAALLNPALAQILEEMGLISYNPIENEVKIKKVAETQTELENLNDAIEKLAYTEILISVNYDKEDADKQFFDIFGFYPGEDGPPPSIQKELLVDVMPTYALDPGAPSIDSVLDQLPEAPIIEPIDFSVPVNLSWDFSGGLGPAGTGSGAGSAFGGGAPIIPDIPDISIGVTADTAAASAQVDELATYAAGQDATVTVDADTSNAQAAVDDIFGGDITNTYLVTIGADATSAEQTIGDVNDAAGSMPTGTVELDGDNAAALEAIAAVNDAGSSMPDQSIAIGGDPSDYYNSIPETGVVLGTNYIDIVSRTVGTTAYANGGVLDRYANGGVLFEAAEAGPELVSMANGGTALLPSRGIYMGQVGDYVHTAPATSVKMNGHPIVIENHFHGVTDWDATAREVARKIVPALQQAVRIHETSVGFTQP